MQYLVPGVGYFNDPASGQQYLVPGAGFIASVRAAFDILVRLRRRRR